MERENKTKETEKGKRKQKKKYWYEEKRSGRKETECD